MLRVYSQKKVLNIIVCLKNNPDYFLSLMLTYNIFYAMKAYFDSF